MKSANDFIRRVSNKMGYAPTGFTVIEDTGVYEEVKEDVVNALDNGMAFIQGTTVADSIPNQIAKEYNSLATCKVLTYDKFNGVTLLINYNDNSDTVEGVNIQSLGVINSFLDELINGIPVKEVDKESTDHISLKDYYKLNFPDNRIGRKSDETLIKELEEAGFKVD